MRKQMHATAIVRSRNRPSLLLTVLMRVLKMARPERFELPTLCFEGRCSIQLSYGRIRLKTRAMLQVAASPDVTTDVTVSGFGTQGNIRLSCPGQGAYSAA